MKDLKLTQLELQILVHCISKMFSVGQITVADAELLTAMYKKLAVLIDAPKEEKAKTELTETN